MSWNNGKEKKKFDKQQERQAEEYRQYGMSEKDIQEMYQFDLEMLRKERVFRIHNQPIQDKFDDKFDESKSPMLGKFFDKFSIFNDFSDNRYWWIEEIDNQELVKRLKMLSEGDIEILTLIIEGYKQVEIAQLYSVSSATISKKLKRIRNFLKNFSK